MGSPKKEQPGEGNREAARRFNEREREFVQSEAGKKAIKDHPVKSTEEGHRNERSAQKAREKAKEKDPQVTRDYRQPNR
jgi:hypothetical protein